MYVTTNSALVWKRLADENQQSAKFMARLSIGLFIALLVVVIYAFSARSSFSSLCTTIERGSQEQAAFKTREFARDVALAYCT